MWSSSRCEIGTLFPSVVPLLASLLLACPVSAAELIMRRPVASSSIASIGYSARKRLLDVEFRSGVVYRYEQVPKTTAAEFLDAESKGRYFMRYIRGKFPYRQLAD
jgi:hypothetical protein